MGGRNTYVFWRGTSAIDLPPQGNFDVREGDRGGSCRFQSPSLFLFPNPPALVCGGGGAAETAGRCFKRPAAVPFGFWVFWVFCSFKARSGQTAKSWAKRAARSLAGARRRLRNQIDPKGPTFSFLNYSITVAAEVAAGDRDFFYTSRETAAESKNGRREVELLEGTRALAHWTREQARDGSVTREHADGESSAGPRRCCCRRGR